MNAITVSIYLPSIPAAWGSQKSGAKSLPQYSFISFDSSLEWYMVTNSNNDSFIQVVVSWV